MDRIERPARRIIDVGLGQSRSAIEPDILAWDAPVARDLSRRVVDSADTGRRTFLEKLQDEMAGAPRESVLLLAELLTLHALPLTNLSAAVKLGRVTTVLSWLTPPAELPADLRDGLAAPGVFNGGVGFNVQIWQQLGWLLNFLEEWHEEPASVREAALQDPWNFRTFVAKVDTGQQAIRNSLLYLAFPDVFLPIVRQADKAAIRDRFAERRRGNDSMDIDADLFDIHRRHLEQAGGKPVNYYDEEWLPLWRKQKPKAADNAPRAWLVSGSDDESVFIDAEHLGFVAPDATREQVAALVDAGYEHLDYARRNTLATSYFNFLSTMKVDDLVARIADDKLRTGVITGDPERVDERLRRSVTWTSTAVGRVEDLPAQLRAELAGQQGAVVDITAALPALTEETPEEPTRLQLPAATRQFANSLHFDLPWLQKLITVLQTRKQIVLYGPPGTGKTYLARELARHIAAPTAVRLVQFHPSYAYEDFFEGFRPRAKGDTATFELVPGPLRQLAAAAEADKGRPYVLIIDEINRANLSKVFGELYFLLEYRDETIDLQYSPGDRFKLPANIFVIGTMNTADRSIALVDAAMRRRFAFVELHPDQPPVRDLLSRWCKANGKTDGRAELLARLNREIDDHEFKIGPSYLMKPDADHGLDVVWEHSILPLLEEHYYDRMSRQKLHDTFGLDALRRRP